MQKITVTGRLGKDAQQKTPANGGNPFITFTLASDAKVKGEDKTTWYEVIMQVTNRNKGIIPYLTKGKGIVVIGDLDISTYLDKENNTRVRASVSADSVDFWGTATKQEGNTQPTTSAPTESKATAKPKVAETIPEDIPMTSGSVHVDDDDLPF